MKTYGDSRYKGFVIARNKNNVKTKHFIRAIDYYQPTKTYHITVDAPNDSQYTFENYKYGSAKKIDIAIKTWHKERRKAGRRGIRSHDFKPF